MRIVAIVAFLALSSLALAVQFDVAARTERCFTEEYQQDQLVVGEYHAFPGYNMEIEIRVGCATCYVLKYIGYKPQGCRAIP